MSGTDSQALDLKAGAQPGNGLLRKMVPGTDFSEKRCQAPIFK